MNKSFLASIVFITSASPAMHKDDHSTKPLHIPGNNHERWALTTSKSPGDWQHALGSLDLRSHQELQEARAHGHNQAKNDALAIEITSFLGTESIVLIKRIIDEVFHSQVCMGDKKIDGHIKELIKDHKNRSITHSSTDLSFDETKEKYSTYRIRTDPVLSSEMDVQALKIALLVNKAVRFAASK